MVPFFIAVFVGAEVKLGSQIDNTRRKVNNIAEGTDILGGRIDTTMVEIRIVQ